MAGRHAREERGMQVEPKGRPLKEGECFVFECRKGLACFGKCCRMKLELTPYDVFRLRRTLRISSERFLYEYTHLEPGQLGGFPQVVLRPGRKGRCVFLRSYGCSVYADRPGACRNFPLSRGISVEGTTLYYYQQLPEFCLGSQTDHSWSVAEWKECSGLEPYECWNNIFVRLIRRFARIGPRRVDLEQVYGLMYQVESPIETWCAHQGISFPKGDDGILTASVNALEFLAESWERETH